MSSSAASIGDPDARCRAGSGQGRDAEATHTSPAPAAPGPADSADPADSAGPADQLPPDDPADPSGGAVIGRTVLLPRLGEPDALAEALGQAGARVLRAAVTRTVTTPEQERALARMSQDLVAGRAAWLVLTSARTARALAPHLISQPAYPLPGRPEQPTPASLAGTRVAVVGPATARAWQEATGRAPDLVARGSATALLDEPRLSRAPAAECESGVRHATTPHSHSVPRTRISQPGTPQRLLLPASALADPALAEGLRRAGWQVEQVAAYTTLTVAPREVPQEVRRAWSGGGVDAVVLTAPSTARAVVELLGLPPPPTRVVAIGTTTARAATALGLEVAAVAAAPTPVGVREAVAKALRAP